MRKTSPRIVRWIQIVGLVAIAALAWALFVPADWFWVSALVAGLIGSAVTTVVLVRVRSLPTLAEVITAAETEPAAVPVVGRYVGRAGLRSRG